MFLVLVMILIWAYFREFKMSIAAILALLHDLLVTVGVYALIGFSVTPATMIGVLTILGYSLYDTVVVFDKIRENTHDITNSRHTYSYQANAAVNQVLVALTEHDDHRRAPGRGAAHHRRLRPRHGPG